MQTIKISDYFLLERFRKTAIVPGGGYIFKKLLPDFFMVLDGQAGSRKAAFISCKAEITPFGLKNRISHKFLHFLAVIWCSNIIKLAKFIDARENFC